MVRVLVRDHNGIDVLELVMRAREISRIGEYARFAVLDEHATMAELGDLHGVVVVRLVFQYCAGRRHDELMFVGLLQRCACGVNSSAPRQFFQGFFSREAEKSLRGGGFEPPKALGHRIATVQTDRLSVICGHLSPAHLTALVSPRGIRVECKQI